MQDLLKMELTVGDAEELELCGGSVDARFDQLTLLT